MNSGRTYFAQRCLFCGEHIEYPAKEADYSVVDVHVEVGPQGTSQLAHIACLDAVANAKAGYRELARDPESAAAQMRGLPDSFDDEAQPA